MGKGRNRERRRAKAGKGKGGQEERKNGGKEEWGIGRMDGRQGGRDNRSMEEREKKGGVKKDELAISRTSTIGR